jgi:hypothetical protein
MGLFGSTKVDPKKMVSEMSVGLRKEMRAIDRQILQIEREQQKTKAEIKKHAKKNDIDVCKILAKELVNSQKAVSRMHASKAQINSVMVSLANTVSTGIITFLPDEHEDPSSNDPHDRRNREINASDAVDEQTGETSRAPEDNDGDEQGNDEDGHHR